jgi:hypothetical protein
MKLNVANIKHPYARLYTESTLVQEPRQETDDRTSRKNKYVLPGMFSVKLYIRGELEFHRIV